MRKEYVLVQPAGHSRKTVPPRTCATAKLEKMPAVARRTVMNIFVERSQWCGVGEN